MAGGAGGKLTHASLYEVPPELRAGPLGGGAAPTDDGAGAWLTGIQEVALPMAVKLKVRSGEGPVLQFAHACTCVLAHITPLCPQNIEDTERAKAVLLEAHRARMAGDGGEEPSAPAVDYARACPLPSCHARPVPGR